MSKEQESITFQTTSYFDNFYGKTAQIDCEMIKMLSDNKLNLDGSLNESSNISREELWLYIFYLCKHNRNEEDVGKEDNIFDKMVVRTGNTIKSSAPLYISTIKEFMKYELEYLSTKNLIQFLNKLQGTKQWKTIKIPIFEKVYNDIIQKLSQEPNTTFKNKEGDEGVNLCMTYLEDGKINIKRCKD